MNWLGKDPWDIDYPISHNKKSDEEVIAHALSMWSNYIETGDVLRSSNDAKNCGNPEQIKPLDLDQMKFVVRLKEMVIDILKK